MTASAAGHHPGEPVSGDEAAPVLVKNLRLCHGLSRVHEAAARPESRVLVLSDQSVFINGMMLQPDNDNFDFAYNCVNWLTGPGQRKQVLLLDQGIAITSFDVPVKWVLDGPPPSLGICRHCRWRSPTGSSTGWRNKTSSTG